MWVLRYIAIDPSIIFLILFFCPSHWFMNFWAVWASKLPLKLKTWKEHMAEDDRGTLETAPFFSRPQVLWYLRNWNGHKTCCQVIWWVSPTNRRQLWSWLWNFGPFNGFNGPAWIPRVVPPADGQPRERRGGGGGSFKSFCEDVFVRILEEALQWVWGTWQLTCCFTLPGRAWKIFRGFSSTWIFRRTSDGGELWILDLGWFLLGRKEILPQFGEVKIRKKLVVFFFWMNPTKISHT